MFWDTWQLELKIIRRLVPDLSAFEESLEGPLLILSNWYRLCRSGGTPRRSLSIVLFVIDQGRAISAISLGLCVINLEAGGRMRHEGARLTEVERCSHDRR